MSNDRGVFTEEDEIELSVWDRDRMSANDFLGQATIQLKEFATINSVGVCILVVWPFWEGWNELNILVNNQTLRSIQGHIACRPGQIPRMRE